MPTQDGLPIRYDFNHEEASLVTVPWLYGRPSSILKGGKTCYEAQR